jgi:hypothetical protein
MNTIDEIFKKHNWPTRIIPDDTDLLDIEREIKFQLPEDHKDFISRYGGHETQIGEEYIKLWDKEHLLPLNKGYEIFENLPETIGISDNGAGEFIGIEKLNDGGLRIILTPFIDLDKQYHIEIGKSFTDFVLKLDKGEKWFKDIEKDS